MMRLSIDSYLKSCFLKNNRRILQKLCKLVMNYIINSVNSVIETVIRMRRSECIRSIEVFLKSCNYIFVCM